MNALLHPTLARAMACMAPPSSIVHQIVSEDKALRIDMAMLRDKQSNGYACRNHAQALRMQIERQGQTGSTK